MTAKYITNLITRAILIKEDAALMGRPLTEAERRIVEMAENLEAIPVGWLCPRCGAVNAPDVRQCDCEPGVEDNSRPRLPHTVVGPKETK